MKEIQLTQGKVALVDDEDYEVVNRHRWWCSEDTKNHRFYALGRICGKAMFMHQFILAMNGSMAGMTDHKDRDGLNNRKGNIRGCTNSQNSANRGMSRNNTSGYKGVSWNKSKKRWEVYIRVNGKLLHLGRFCDKNIAAGAYNIAAVRIFGDFARVNDIL